MAAVSSVATVRPPTARLSAVELGQAQADVVVECGAIERRLGRLQRQQRLGVVALPVELQPHLVAPARDLTVVGLRRRATQQRRDQQPNDHYSLVAASSS